MSAKTLIEIQQEIVRRWPELMKCFEYNKNEHYKFFSSSVFTVSARSPWVDEYKFDLATLDDNFNISEFIKLPHLTDYLEKFLCDICIYIEVIHMHHNNALIKSYNIPDYLCPKCFKSDLYSYTTTCPSCKRDLCFDSGSVDFLDEINMETKYPHGFLLNY